MATGKKFTSEDIRGLIDSSGFPFEVTAARVLQELGFTPEAAHRIYDPQRGKDIDIDIAATFSEQLTTISDKPITSAIWLGLECKASAMPYVLFGLPRVDEKSPGMMDPDYSYIHINTTRDLDHPNRYGIGVFLRDSVGPSSEIASSPLH